MRLIGLLFAAGLGFAQTPLDRVAAAMQDYARGVTENKFDAGCTITRFDLSGHVVKTKKTTHLLEFTKGSYRSATEGSEPEWSGTYQVHGGRGTIHLELYTDEGAFDPVFQFSPQTRKKLHFDIASPSGGNSFEVTYRPQATCRAFAAGNKGGFTIADSSCESGHFVLDESAAIPLRGSFDALGFPVQSGKESMGGYHVEVEFQAVTLPGAKRPFLFPKRVVATFIFDGAKLMSDCSYTLHAGRK